MSSWSSSLAIGAAGRAVESGEYGGVVGVGVEGDEAVVGVGVA